MTDERPHGYPAFPTGPEYTFNGDVTVGKNESDCEVHHQLPNNIKYMSVGPWGERGLGSRIQVTSFGGSPGDLMSLEPDGTLSLGGKEMTDDLLRDVAKALNEAVALKDAQE